MKKARPRVRMWILGIVLPIMIMTACGSPAPPSPSSEDSESSPPEASSTTTADLQCPDPPPCGDDCSNHPYEPTGCWTTQYGPAQADIIIGNPLKSTNMLYCEGGTYALCFFSGPPDPPDDKTPLPCVLGGSVANCTCQAYTSGPYFVDINAILNLGAYYETVNTCRTDGSGCANIVNCGRDGSAEGCSDQAPAPVCGYVANQNPDDAAASLIPKADLISTFSFAMDDEYQLGSTPCEAGLYAGCMTAPCFYPEGAAQPPSDGDPVQCECPVYDGVFQVGQNGQECSIPPNPDGIAFVWSAANSIMDTDGDAASP